MTNGQKVRHRFTICINFFIHMLLTYAGNIHPIGSELYLLQEFNRGVALQYRVNFPVISPLPKLTALTVNDNILCFATGDTPGDAAYVTTISLQHMLFFKSGTSGIYPMTPSPPTQAPPPEITRKPVKEDSRPATEAPGQAPITQRVTTIPNYRLPSPVKPFGQGKPGFLSNSTECGINTASTHGPVALVFKGYSYDRGEWPWLVALYKRKYSSLSYICAGTLISERHVVSAAHCMQRKSSYTAIKNIVVKAGVYNLEDWSDDITVTRSLVAASIHESYNASSLANDILVMTLDKDVPLNYYIKPACLWSSSPNLNRIVGKSGVVAGWGANEMGPGGKGEPRMVEMPIVSTATCRASKPEFHSLTSSKTLCAGDHSGAGPCLGDSGGGLYILDKGRWRLRGVVSLSLWTENGENTCNLEDYVVFTDTAQYLPWIAGVMIDSSPATEAPRPAPITQRVISRTNFSTPSPVKPFGPKKPGYTSNSTECGITASAHDPVPLVFRGNSYDRGEWPWLVAIYKRINSSSSYICAGTLISEKHVVSAASCMQLKWSYTGIKDIIVKAGAYNLEDWSDEITVTRSLVAAAIHEAYNASSLANNIVVMTLDKAVPLNPFIKPACLWSSNPDLNRIVGTWGVVGGWGANEIGLGKTGEPRIVRMPVVSTATCRESKPAFHFLTSSKTLCAGARNGAGPCLGDSGGGLYILDKGRWRLRGVVSLSLRTKNGENTCNLQDYVVFTDTAQYLPWIAGVMSNSIR